MIWRKTMNNEQNKNEVLRGPLIFTVPASHFPFLVALNVGWLDVTEPTAEEKRRAHKATGRSNEQLELQCCRGALWEKLYNWALQGRSAKHAQTKCEPLMSASYIVKARHSQRVASQSD
jgi:hypothetical protein